MSDHTHLSRRDFLRQSAQLTLAASGSLVVGVNLTACAAARPLAETGHWQADAWIELTPDNRVIFTLDRVEMGQGTYTGLTTLVAEELDVEPTRIEVRFAPVGDAYRNPLFKLQLTGGSTSLATSWERLRNAGAGTRAVLVAAAARIWQVDAASLRTEDGQVFRADGRTLAYGQLLELAARERMPSSPRLKAAADYRYIGKRNARLDAAAKVTGTAVYGIDVSVPGMLHAVLVRPPRIGARVGEVDASAALAMPGVVEVVSIERGVALVADTYWRARKAAGALVITWDEREALSLSDEDVLALYRRAAADDDGETERHDGRVDHALRGAGDVVEAEYQVPFLAHATMEPMNCTVAETERGLEIWAPTQAPDLARIAAARVTRYSPGDIHVHTTFLGGGFGRRLTQDYVEEAAAIAVAVKRPVQLRWSREDDTRHDVYRPAMLHRLRAGLSGTELLAWDHQVVGPQILDWYVRDAAPAQFPWTPKFLYGTLASVGLMAEGLATPKDTSAIEGATNYPYSLKHVRVRHTHVDAGVPISYWRSVGHSHTAFAVETFMDEIAHQTGQDPLAFRLARLDNVPRWRQVLEQVARRAGWGTPLAEGRARGLAVHESFGSYVAQVVEVAIEHGEIRVHKVWCAVDCGFVVNPDIVHAQMESGIIFGLTAALYGEIHLDNGAVRESNFHDQPLLRLHQSPAIDVLIVDSEAPPSGVGEPAVPPVMPALGNALFALTGKRQRRMPFKAEV